MKQKTFWKRGMMFLLVGVLLFSFVAVSGTGTTGTNRGSADAGKPSVAPAGSPVDLSISEAPTITPSTAEKHVDEVWQKISRHLGLKDGVMGNVWDPTAMVWKPFDVLHPKPVVESTSSRESSQLITTEKGTRIFKGYGGVYTLALDSEFDNGYIRAFMRMITKHEGTSQPCDGISPYRILVGGNPISDPLNRYGGKCGKSTNYFNGYKWHPNIKVKGSYGKSTAAGRYQFLTTTWYNQEDDSGWASKYDPWDFSPENQDRVVYQYLLRRGILDLLKEIGDNPDVDSEYFRTRWRKIMAPSEKYITDNSGKARVNNLKNLERGTFKGVDGGKGLGGTWASLPYGCYSSQGCHDWNSERFKSTAKLYAGLLKEELDILEPVS